MLQLGWVQERKRGGGVRERNVLRTRNAPTRRPCLTWSSGFRAHEDNVVQLRSGADRGLSAEHDFARREPSAEQEVAPQSSSIDKPAGRAEAARIGAWNDAQ